MRFHSRGSGRSPHAQGDREQLRVVLDNLVSNAIKFYAARRQVRIVSSIDGGMAQIDVEDDGPGVALEEQERVFESFYPW